MSDEGIRALGRELDQEIAALRALRRRLIGRLIVEVALITALGLWVHWLWRH